MNEMTTIEHPLTPAEADSFFRHVESLQAEQSRGVRRSRNAAWIVAGCACFIAVASAYALAALGPQHSVEWRLVVLRNDTGGVEVHSLGTAPKLATDEEKKALLFSYVMNRESYVWPEMQDEFHAVSLASTKAEQDRYSALVNGKNPTSPQAEMGKDGFIRVHIKSVTILPGGTGQVRFASILYKTGAEPKTINALATIAFSVKPEAKMTDADRLLNPLGFLVSDYNVVPDQP